VAVPASAAAPSRTSRRDFDLVMVGASGTLDGWQGCYD
jgi:hypothetical protein